MSEKSVKIQVKLTDKNMIDFFKQYTYTHFSGLFGPVFGVLTLVLCIRCILMEDYYYAVILGLFTYFFLIAPPIALRKKAKDQLKKVPLFAKPFFYEFSETGLRIFQDKQSQEAAWEQIYKVIGNKNAVYVYTNQRNAWIVPNEALGTKRDVILEIIRKHVPEQKVKIKA